jgi:SAM-dependent methyltransferase
MIEYPLAFSQLSLKIKNKILDVGSSNSVFPLFLASLGCQVFAIDIDKKVLELKNYAKRLGCLELIAEIEDATRLSYPNKFFDNITAISTIEHIIPKDDGDIRAIKEISRTLKDGGKAIITVPYNKEFEVEWVRGKIDNHFFLMRKYDETSIYKRLVEPSGLQLINKIYFGESIKFSKIWYNSPLSIFAFTSPLFVGSFIISRTGTQGSQGVCLTLKKVI